MRKLTAILVDDERRGLTSLEKLLEINCPEVEVIGTADSVRATQKQLKQQVPDLLFLDISMPGQNGFELLREMPSIPFEIIFVTAYDKYMLQAFQYSAVDYLLKPVEEEVLIDAVKRAALRIEQKAGPQPVETFLHNVQQHQSPLKMKLCISTVKGFHVVEIRDIVYCEANSNYTNIHFQSRSMICASRPIHEYETLLGDHHFLRIHKSYLVNLEYIREYVRGEGGSVILQDGREIEVSRRKKELLISRMKLYYKF